MLQPAKYNVNCATYFVISTKILKHVSYVSFHAGNYLYGTGLDYKAATRDIFIDAKNYPLRAAIYIATLSGATYAWTRNPSEKDYEKAVLDSSNDLLLLSQPVRNPDSDAHVQRITQLRNDGVLRRTTFLVTSVMWQDNYDASLDVYDAKCDHLQVTWTNFFRERILDVGFMGRWWYLHKAMQDYDINYTEWEGREGSTSS